MRIALSTTQLSRDMTSYLYADITIAFSRNVEKRRSQQSSVKDCLPTSPARPCKQSSA